MTSSIGWSNDLDKGIAAYNQGDYATALRIWESLAKQGDAGAQFNLGVFYEKGEGVLQDYKTALKWYELSAIQGNATAQYNLCVWYNKGRNVIQDDKIALKLCNLSAKQGNADAQFNLGVFYGNGTGVIQDNIYAHMWWNISASNRHKNAIKYRDIIVKQMKPRDISTAQKLARECVKKKYKGC